MYASGINLTSIECSSTSDGIVSTTSSLNLRKVDSLNLLHNSLEDVLVLDRLVSTFIGYCWIRRINHVHKSRTQLSAPPCRSAAHSKPLGCSSQSSVHAWTTFSSWSSSSHHRLLYVLCTFPRKLLRTSWSTPDKMLNLLFGEVFARSLASGPLDDPLVELWLGLNVWNLHCDHLLFCIRNIDEDRWRLFRI